MKLCKEERLLVGKQLHDKSLSFIDCMVKYNISRPTCQNWMNEYRREAGIQSKTAPIGARLVAQDDYQAMSKEELIKELMKKDIEAAKLKKDMW